MDPTLFHAIATLEIPPGAGHTGPDVGPGVRPKTEKVGREWRG
jgi:hypothetical protein